MNARKLEYTMPMRTLLTITLALTLAACGSTPDSENESQGRHAAQLNTQLGTEYLNRGQYEVALDKLKKAVREDKTYAPAHTVLGVLYEQIGEEQLAGEHYREALKLTPDDGEVNNNYGTFLCRTGQGEDAWPLFEKALEDPFYRTPAVAMANAGQCAVGLDELDKAESYLRRSLGYNPEFPDALLSMAGIADQKQEYLQARGFLQRYEAVAASTPSSLFLGYRVESELQNSRKAEQYRGTLLRDFPDAPEAQDLRGPRQR
jgi:type IV pilus assembly protein PilF